MTELKPKTKNAIFDIESICIIMLDRHCFDFDLEENLERIEHIIDNIRLIERDF